MADTRESRPGGRTQAADGSATAMKAPAPSLVSASPEVSARRRWAYKMVRRASTPVPIYGSAEWLSLSDGDLVKIAAVVRAAECWAQGADTLVEDLRQEIDTRRRINKELEDAEYAERQRAHRAEWSRRPAGRTFAERRAVQMASAEPLPGDFTGRGSA